MSVRRKYTASAQSRASDPIEALCEIAMHAIGEISATISPDALKAIKQIADAIDRSKAHIQSKAIRDELAVYSITEVKRAPDKKRYIELHGQEAFDQNCSIGERKNFTWL